MLAQLLRKPPLPGCGVALHLLVTFASRTFAPTLFAPQLSPALLSFGGKYRSLFAPSRQRIARHRSRRRLRFFRSRFHLTLVPHDLTNIFAVFSRTALHELFVALVSFRRIDLLVLGVAKVGAALGENFSSGFGSRNGYDWTDRYPWIRPTKITFGEMREMGVRGILVYCAESIAISGDQWPDDVRLSEIGPRSSAKSAAGAPPTYSETSTV
jgi:hypothetical protein